MTIVPPSSSSFWISKLSASIFLTPPQPLLIISPLPLPTIHQPHLNSPPLLALHRRRRRPPNPPSSQFHETHQLLSLEEEEDEEEEHVVGDCVVFEEGVFIDPFLAEQEPGRKRVDYKKKQKKKSISTVEAENLVPERWKVVQEEINLTKKEKRKILRDAEFASRLQIMKRGGFRDERYEAYRNLNPLQLNSVRLDHPPAYPLHSCEDEEAEGRKEDGENIGSSSSSSSFNGRVTPKNPRLEIDESDIGLGGIRDMIEKGFDVSAEESSKVTRKLFTKEEKLFLNCRKPDLQFAASSKWLPVHTLAASGQFYLLDLLLKHNVDINAADKDGLTALHKAIMSRKIAVMNYLLRESANPFIKDLDGATLIHYAVQVASPHAIKILLLYNLDVNLPDNYGWTPLHLAVQSRRTDIVKLLLIKGADKTTKNQDGLTPLQMCLYSGKSTQTYQLIKLLKVFPRSVR